MAARVPGEPSPAALRAANERRTLAAAGRNRKLAAAALMRLGPECRAEWEDVATEVILHSDRPWSEIGRRLGLTRDQVVERFRQLLVAADMDPGTD